MNTGLKIVTLGSYLFLSLCQPTWASDSTNLSRVIQQFQKLQTTGESGDVYDRLGFLSEEGFTKKGTTKATFLRTDCDAGITCTESYFVTTEYTSLQSKESRVLAAVFSAVRGKEPKLTKVIDDRSLRQMEVSGIRMISLTPECLKRAIAAVNKQHTMADGSVYAVREIYSGDQAVALLMGHSDETDNTDYLVLVKKEKCEISKAVWTNEGSQVDVFGIGDRVGNL
mgnify:CR=1 FL=1